VINKYPRTSHLPPYRAGGLKHLYGKPLILSEKFDGSNVAIGNSYIYGRSREQLSSHASFDLLKRNWYTLRENIRPDETIFAEWCYAVHSIVYENMTSERELLMFGVRNETSRTMLSWEEVLERSRETNIAVTPALKNPETGGEEFILDARNEEQFYKTVEKLLHEPSLLGTRKEGIVIRSKEGFAEELFFENVYKKVRENFIQGQHWSRNKVTRHCEADRLSREKES